MSAARAHLTNSPGRRLAAHHLHHDEVVRVLQVDLRTGLAEDEVTRRQKEFGRNRVTAPRGPPTWVKFIEQVNQPLVYILLLAFSVTAFLGEWVDSAVMFHTAPIDVASWLRIGGVAGAVFMAVEGEKWIRFGGRRGESATPE